MEKKLIFSTFYYFELPGAYWHREVCFFLSFEWIVHTKLYKQRYKIIINTSINYPFKEEIFACIEPRFRQRGKELHCYFFSGEKKEDQKWLVKRSWHLLHWKTSNH